MKKPSVEVVINLDWASDEEKEFAEKCQKAQEQIVFMGGKYIVVSFEYESMYRIATVRLARLFEI